MTNNRRQLVGKVLPSKMENTIVVQVVRRKAHPVYKKFVAKTKKYYVHDPQNVCNTGDLVRIVESRPLSKLKRWRVVSVEQKAIEV